MTKTELIQEVASQSDLSVRKTATVLDTFLDTIATNVAADEKVVLTGFGTFERRHRQARAGTNPGTSEPIEIPATDYPAFKPGARFKNIVSGE
jgi:DNA-binding protein HU-beta